MIHTVTANFPPQDDKLEKKSALTTLKMSNVSARPE